MKEIKKRLKIDFLILSAYTGGAPGYFPTGNAIKQGGYDVEEGYKLYHIPGPFKENLEELILRETEAFVNNILIWKQNKIVK